jgi:hypothetical protein
MNKETKEYAIKALIEENPNKVAKRLSLLLEDECVDTLIRGVPVEVESVDVEALKKYCTRKNITFTKVTHLDTCNVSIEYGYVDTNSSHADWLDFSIKEAEEAGICKFKYV